MSDQNFASVLASFGVKLELRFCSSFNNECAESKTETETILACFPRRLLIVGETNTDARCNSLQCDTFHAVHSGCVAFICEFIYLYNITLLETKMEMEK